MEPGPRRVSARPDTGRGQTRDRPPNRGDHGPANRHGTKGRGLHQGSRGLLRSRAMKGLTTLAAATVFTAALGVTAVAQDAPAAGPSQTSFTHELLQVG